MSTTDVIVGRLDHPDNEEKYLNQTSHVRASRNIRLSFETMVSLEPMSGETGGEILMCHWSDRGISV